MARPGKALVTSTTSSGIEFQWDAEAVRMKGARDASMDEFLVLIKWSDHDTFLRDVVGFTVFDKSPILKRTLPLRHPLRPKLFCDEYELVDFGIFENRTDTHDPANGNAPVFDWARFLLKFTRPKSSYFSDAQLADPGLWGAAAINKEQNRFTWTADQPEVENRIISGFGVEYLKPGGDAAKPEDWDVVPDERQSVPDWKINLIVNWLQIPLVAIPYQAILDCANTVNSKAISLTHNGKLWVPGKLGFKGLASPIVSYTGADGERYADLAYKFTVRNSGWNFWPARDAGGNVQFRPMRERASKVPPFRETDHQQIFVPG